MSKSRITKCANLFSVFLLGLAPLAIASPASAALNAHGAIWSHQYDGGGMSYDYGNDVAVSPDGSVSYLAGTIRDLHGRSVFTLMAMDKTTGDTKWEVQNPNDDSSSQGTSVMASPDGSKVYLVGTGYTDNSQGFLAAYDAATGSNIWVNKYLSYPSNGTLQVAPDSSKVYYSAIGGVYAFDATSGQSLWSGYVPGSSSTLHSRMSALSADGSKLAVIYPANVSWTNEYQNYGTRLFDTSTGQMIWDKEFDGPDQMQDSAHSIAIDPAGHKVFVTGYSTVAGLMISGLGTTVAYDAADGAQLWVHKENTSGMDLQVTPDGSSLALVSAHAADGHLVVTKLNTQDGAVSWRAGDSSTYLVGGKSLAMDPSGRRVLAAGHKNSRSSIQSFNLQTGAVEWSSASDNKLSHVQTATLAMDRSGENAYLVGVQEVAAGDSSHPTSDIVAARYATAPTAQDAAPEAPDAPTGVTASSPINEAPSITWQPVSGATSYKVYRNGTVVATVTSSNYVDAMLVGEGTMTYTVTAVGDGVESEQSQAVQVIVDLTVPTASGAFGLYAAQAAGKPLVYVVAAATDALAGVQAGEFYVDTDPGVGKGTPMNYADGALHYSKNEVLDLKSGKHRIYVRAIDKAGNWSAVTTADFNTFK
jgi:hypothetical protein